jgi:hypothetical protein
MQKVEFVGNVKMSKTLLNNENTNLSKNALCGNFSQALFMAVHEIFASLFDFEAGVYRISLSVKYAKDGIG